MLSAAGGDSTRARSELSQELDRSEEIDCPEVADCSGAGTCGTARGVVRTANLLGWPAPRPLPPLAAITIAATCLQLYPTGHVHSPSRNVSGRSPSSAAEKNAAVSYSAPWPTTEPVNVAVSASHPTLSTLLPRA